MSTNLEQLQKDLTVLYGGNWQVVSKEITEFTYRYEHASDTVEKKRIATEANAYIQRQKTGGVGI